MQNTIQPITIDPSIQAILEDCANKLETKTGTKYQIIVHQHGTHTQQNLIIKSYEKRSQYLIYDMDPQYCALEGTYENYQQIKDKLQSLLQELVENYEIDPNDGKCFWKCPQCHKWDGSERQDGYQCGRNSGLDNHSCCQNCSWYFDSIWGDVKINLDSGNIYQCSGGSLYVLHPIGKIKFE